MQRGADRLGPRGLQRLFFQRHDGGAWVLRAHRRIVHMPSPLPRRLSFSPIIRCGKLSGGIWALMDQGYVPASLDSTRMEEKGSAERSLTFEQLAELRDKTEAISQLLQKQLMAHLETIRPLFAPRRLLGKYVGVKEEVVGADRAFAQLQEKYKEVCGKPFALPPELDDSPLSVIDNRLELYPWEYVHQAKGERETKTVTITSPIRWVLTYSSDYTLSQLIHSTAGKEQRRADAIRQFVVNMLVMQFLLAKFPGITQLLTDLRYEVHTEKSPGLGELSLVTISSCLPSFRPSDSLILAATRLSGVPAFIELIDVDAMHALQDPLKLRIKEMFR